MAVELKYGDSGSLTIEIPTEAILVDFSTPRGTPLDDPSAAVAAAVSTPLEFPRLQDATIPGDRIVLAVDRGVPQMPAVVAGVIHTLIDGGVQPRNLEIVLAASVDESSDDPLSDLSDLIRPEIQVSRHDAYDRESLAYLAASKDAHPIYFNRKLADADVVLPISTLRLDQRSDIRVSIPASIPRLLMTLRRSVIAAQVRAIGRRTVAVAVKKLRKPLGRWEFSLRFK